MGELEALIGLVLAAVVLAAAARRVGAPYPVFLAVGGAILAFVPGAPTFTVAPELALALFVAPVLLDAAYDASPRDLRDNWAPVTGLVVVAVGLTTIAVAVVARALMPGYAHGRRRSRSAPWSPPDAAAATAVLRQLRPPHRILTILEGESLLNDASALLIYRLAVGAVAASGFLDRSGRADLPVRGGRQRDRRSGARLALPAVDRSRAGRADRHHSSVRHHVRRLDPGRPDRAVRCADDGVLRHYRGADGARAHARRGSASRPTRCGRRSSSC